MQLSLCCLAVTVDGTELKLDNGWYEDSWTYPCALGGSVSVLWQLYRPLLGNTVEIATGKNPLLCLLLLVPFSASRVTMSSWLKKLCNHSL